MTPPTFSAYDDALHAENAPVPATPGAPAAAEGTPGGGALAFLKSLIGQDTPSDTLVENFARYGQAMNAPTLEIFETQARAFYEEAMRSSDPLYSVVKLAGGRVGVDYNAERRGIFTRSGKPLAYYAPNYAQMGYRNRDEAIRDWKKTAA